MIEGISQRMTWGYVGFTCIASMRTCKWKRNRNIKWTLDIGFVCRLERTSRFDIYGFCVRGRDHTGLCGGLRVLPR